MSATRFGFQYVVIRCVPRADRDEFVNVGVVVYCQARDFLAAVWDVNPERLRCLSPDLDIDAVRGALDSIRAVCAGEPAGGAPAEAPRGTRFGFVSAPRSTVVRPGPVHGGLTTDPGAELEQLLRSQVR
ncbi:MAG: DUF3037 domain-containing protein [Nocardioidaceae bacterium]